MPRAYLIAALAIAGLSVAAGVIDPVDPFEPNHLFVASSAGGVVYEFDEDGNLVPKLVTGINQLTGLVAAHDVAFGPDGALYVTDFQLDRVHVFDSNGGGALAQIGGGTSLDAPTGLAFGPRGGLFVASSATDEVLRFECDGSFDTSIGGAGLDDPRGVAFGPDGHVFVTSFATDEVLEFDPSGVHVGTYSALLTLDGPTGLTFGPDGNLYVASSATNQIVVFDAAGGVANTFGTGLNSPTDIAFGPDGNIYVTSQGTGDVIVYDRSFNLVGTIGGGSGLTAPTGLAFSPFVLGATLSGKVSVTGSEDTKVKSPARVSYAPGSGRATIYLTDAADVLAGTFGGSVLTFHGFGGTSGPKFNSGSFVGAQVAESGLEGGVGALGLAIKGKTLENGDFTVSKFTGNLHRASRIGSIDAKIKSSKKLP